MARYVVMRTSADVFGSSAYVDPVEFDDLDKAVDYAAGLTLHDYRSLGDRWGCDCGYSWEVFEKPADEKKCVWSGWSYIQAFQVRGDQQPHLEDGRPRQLLITPQTKPEDLPEKMAAQARELGPIDSESYLAIVLEADLSWRGGSVFRFLKDANRHADAAVAESDTKAPIAMVFDAQYTLVYDARRLSAHVDWDVTLTSGRTRVNEQEPKPPLMDAPPRWLTYDDVDGPKVVRLSRGEWVIGRDADCAIVVRDFGCSRRHAKLVVEVDGVRMVDLKSKGGTQVTRTPVTEARLKSGDEVRLGTVLFQYVEGPAPPAPTTRVAADQGKQRPGLTKLTAALERPPGSLREETHLGELGNTFGALLYAVHTVSEAFKVELPRERLLLINTVGELLDLIEQAGGRVSEQGDG